VSEWSQTVDWLTTATNWTKDNGIVDRLVEHAGYSALTLGIALVIALPIGFAIGHTGRGSFVALNSLVGARAIPTFAVVVLLYKLEPLALWPVVVGLVLLAVPPIVANAAAAIAAVDPAVRDGARGMGMTGWQVLWRVELPNSVPLILAGVRSAATQVIATATIAAYVSLGGLGRFVIDGYALVQYEQAYGGAVLVGAFALIVDGALALFQRAATPAGLRSGRAVPRSATARA